jgi:hypothetical protein
VKRLVAFYVAEHNERIPHAGYRIRETTLCELGETSSGCEAKPPVGGTTHLPHASDDQLPVVFRASIVNSIVHPGN